jgi:ubiquitin carboxyl-terminal hydrolase 16/45
LNANENENENEEKTELCKNEARDIENASEENVPASNEENLNDSTNNGEEIESNDPVVIDKASEISQKLESLNLKEEKNETVTTDELNETFDLNSDNDDTSSSNDFENRFKLDSMISLSTNKSSSNERGVASLESCLNNFTSIETLSDKINCDNCTSKLNETSSACKYKQLENSKKKSSKQQNSNKVYTKAIKQYLICDLPRILTIHLKRFQQQGFRLEKSNKHVNFPLILNMAPYTSKMCINLSNKQSQVSEVLYSLYGIVEHSGKLNFGHYTAYVKSRNKLNLANFLGTRRLCHLKKVMKSFRENNFSSKSKEETFENPCASSKEDLQDNSSTDAMSDTNEKWYYISDAHVSEVSVSKVLKVQAYILFYERVK